MSRSKVSVSNAIGQLMQLLKFAPLVAATILIVGCGVSSSPSASDAKHQLEAAIEQCPAMSMTDFEKDNGVQIDPGRYNVSVKFALTLKPVPDVLKLIDKYAEQQAKLITPELKQQIADQRKFNKDREAQQDAFLKTLNGQESSYRNSPEGIAFEQETYVLNAKLGDLMQGPRAAGYNFDESYAGVQPAIAQQAAAVFFDKCKYMHNVLIDQLVNKLWNSDPTHTQTTQLTAEANIIMIKSDNGWIMPESHY